MLVDSSITIMAYIFGVGVGRNDFGPVLSTPMMNVTWAYYGRFPKCHSVFWGRESGTLKSDIVSKKHPHWICSDLRLSN